MARKLAAVAFSLGCFQASSVFALGLGDLKLESFLNEPLKASVNLLNIDGLHEEEIRIRLATRDDFEKLGIDRAYFLTSIVFDVIVDDNGAARIVISSQDPVLEPYLDFVVEARWPSGRLLREYTVLIDPPVFSESSTVVSASQRVEDVEGIPAPAKKKVTESSSSGTHVAIKKSGLAPGSMPQRNFNSATSAGPMSGSRYMIHRDQTLWDIASQARPAGTSVHQTMLDIQRLNPDAFINGNINRIKAGYIIYLPNADDISSKDLDAALVEVREQNAAWREGRDAEVHATRGPALRISADSEDDTETEAAGIPGDAAGSMPDPNMIEGLDSDDAGERLAAMQQQVETLQRVVSLKDEQIAALQSALTDADEATAAGEVAPSDSSNLAETGESALPADELAEDGVIADSAQTAEPAETVAEPEEPIVPVVAEIAESDIVKPAVSKPATPAPKPAVNKPASDGGWMSNLLYGLAAVVVAVLAFVFVRRRREDDHDDGIDTAETGARDAFSGADSGDEELDQDDGFGAPASSAGAEAESMPDPDDRGYGGHKHDAYASDVEASDALAEADIYIAYGRHPQAIDLLNNAIASEPNDPVYRLKLIEIYSEIGDRGAAAVQFEQLQALGDAESNAQAEQLMQRMETAPADAGQEHVELGTDTVAQSPGLSPNPLKLQSVSDGVLEDDFAGLAIEEPGVSDDLDDLDLSADFEPAESDQGESEELVLADDENGLSTKLDLARAYLDMGDEDGARQILDEVTAEGNEEIKAEARALLDRIA